MHFWQAASVRNFRTFTVFFFKNQSESLRYRLLKLAKTCICHIQDNEGAARPAAHTLINIFTSLCKYMYSTISAVVMQLCNFIKLINTFSEKWAKFRLENLLSSPAVSSF